MGPRTKATIRKTRPVLVKVGLDDVIPLDLVQYISSLPSSSDTDAAGQGSSLEEQAPKRRKLDLSRIPSGHIARGGVSVTRDCADNSNLDCDISHQDVGRHLGIHVGQAQLDISWRPNPLLPGNLASINLRPQDIGENTKDIIQISTMQKGSNDKRRTSTGALWTTVDLIFQRRGVKVFLDLKFNLHWNETPSPWNLLRSTQERSSTGYLIDRFFPTVLSGDSARRQSTAWSPMDFYEAAFVPPKNDEIAHSIDVPGLGAKLFPYQKRTLQWLLTREGVHWSKSSAAIEALAEEHNTPVADTFRPITDVSDKEVQLSDIFHVVTTDTSAFRRADLAVKGGILAEEMGLGKTLEILGLILLHSRPGSPKATLESGTNLVSTGATLIVTPESLRAQWISEISRHAPRLRVKYYEGRKKLASETEDQAVSELAAYDIVITTYTILSAELHFATDPPERSRRYERAYRRAKSPLVQISWWRVCLDEAQMIENGYSQAAVVARVIPRINAWGITGTPVKDDVKDLFGLLLFLRYEPYCSAPQVWQSLIKDHKSIFQQLFGRIALRHTKILVRDELLLPAQKRFAISMPFTAVEEQHYQSLHREMTEACGFDIYGAPAVEDWKPEDYEEEMRVWLNRLRQTALHPEVAAYNRRALGYNKDRPMRTVDEVLDAMLAQSETMIKTDQRAYLLSRLTRGQLLENGPRVREALVIWEEVKKEAEKLVTDARSELVVIIGEQDSRGAIHSPSIDASGSESDSEGETGDNETQKRLGDCRRKLRTALELQHKAVFFCANAYFQIKENPELTEPESEEYNRLKLLEEDGYEEAKTIRREILRESHRKASRLMDKISLKAQNQAFAEVPELVVHQEKGIETSRIVDGLEDLYSELNMQANILDEWRESAVQLLLKPLVDEEDEVETTGEELGESAKIQDDLMVYVQALRAAISDRQDAISGQTNELVRHETQTSIRLARDGDGPSPRKLLELLAIRAEIKPDPTRLSMRGAISDLRGIISRLSREGRAAYESEIADRHLKATQKLINEQNKAALALEAEIERFTTTMNARLEYYRQLQSVSDSVLPYEGSRSDAAINRLLQTEEDLRRKLGSAEAKHRYLLNLKESGSKSNEPRMCIICQTPFTIGVLTVCGHEFCKECMMMWFKAHHNCPVCKRGLKSSNLHDITIKPQEFTVHNDGPGGSTGDANRSPQSRRKHAMIYSDFNSEKLAEIKNIELDGPSFTTKVDTLVRHLIWLRESDPGAKSIVFSQYKGFLEIIRTAFRRFRIGFASIDEPGGITRFKEDPAIECFLLHARAHSSGLNLVNASHVFLCEPLLNTALELQAIARVDRIGQQHETTVWLYLVSGTVEESIYDLSVQRRMKHIRRSDKGKSKESTPELLDASIEAANTLELEQAALSRLMSKDKTAGEMVDKSDLWECLFGHVAKKEKEREAEPARDSRFQEQAVKSYLAAEAAEERRAKEI